MGGRRTRREPLIVVTADHGHGYEVYGTVDTEVFNTAEDDAGKRSAIRIYDRAGFPGYEDADGDTYPDTWDVPIVFAGVVNNHPDYTEDFQVSLTHTCRPWPTPTATMWTTRTTTPTASP